LGDLGILLSSLLTFLLILFSLSITLISLLDFGLVTLLLDFAVFVGVSLLELVVVPSLFSTLVVVVTSVAVAILLSVAVFSFVAVVVVVLYTQTDPTGVST
jgi:hypothetical protein